MCTPAKKKDRLCPPAGVECFSWFSTGCALSIVCLCFVAGMISSQLHGDKRDAKEQGQSSKRTMTTPERAASPHSRPKLANSVPDRSSTHAKLAPIPELSKRIESHERPAMPAGVSRARSQHAVSPGNGTPAAPQLRVILSGSCPFVQNASLDLEVLQPRNVDESDKVSPRRPSPKRKRQNVSTCKKERQIVSTCGGRVFFLVFDQQHIPPSQTAAVLAGRGRRGGHGQGGVGAGGEGG